MCISYVLLSCLLHLVGSLLLLVYRLDFVPICPLLCPVAGAPVVHCLEPLAPLAPLAPSPPLVDSLPHPAFGPWGGAGGALSEVGETLHQVALARDELDASVQHTFIDPLQELHGTELKDIRVRGWCPDQPCSLPSVKSPK